MQINAYSEHILNLPRNKPDVIDMFIHSLSQKYIVRFMT